MQAFGKHEASKIILYDSPYGIGKNEKLVTAMVSLGCCSRVCNDGKLSVEIRLVCCRRDVEKIVECKRNK